MKRPILLALVAVGIAFGICFWGLAPKPVPVSVTEPIASAPVAAPTRLAVPAVTLTPSVQPTRIRHEPVTNDRARIFDSPDIMATISEIRKSGTQDEKDWANYLLRSCTHVLAKPTPYTDPSNEPKVSLKTDSPELARQKQRASKQLASRCEGVGNLSPQDREALLTELRQGAEQNQSVLGQLNAIKDDRWNDVQAKLIADSLYGDDPIVAKTAFMTLLASIDSDAPGGKDRQLAFQLALAPKYLNFPLSQYEQLQACKSLGWCNSWGADQDTTPPNATVARLMTQYEAAVESHMDARSILTIR